MLTCCSLLHVLERLLVAISLVAVFAQVHGYAVTAEDCEAAEVEESMESLWPACYQVKSESPNMLLVSQANLLFIRHLSLKMKFS